MTDTGQDGAPHAPASDESTGAAPEAASSWNAAAQAPASASGSSTLFEIRCGALSTTSERPNAHKYHLVVQGMPMLDPRDDTEAHSSSYGADEVTRVLPSCAVEGAGASYEEVRCERTMHSLCTDTSQEDIEVTMEPLRCSGVDSPRSVMMAGEQAQDAAQSNSLQATTLHSASQLDMLDVQRDAGKLATVGSDVFQLPSNARSVLWQAGKPAAEKGWLGQGTPGHGSGGSTAAFESFNVKVAGAPKGILKKSRLRRVSRSSLGSMLASLHGALPGGRRHVRFKGVPSLHLVTVLGTIIKYFRPGTWFMENWKYFVAVVTAIDFLMMPIAMVYEALAEARAHDQLGYIPRRTMLGVAEDTMAQAYHFIYVSLALDGIFIMDAVIKCCQAVVMDCGFVGSQVDTIVHSCSHLKVAVNEIKFDPVSAAASTLNNGKFVWGPCSRRMSWVAPISILAIAPLWIVHFSALHHYWLVGAHACRLVRVSDLLKYLAECESDVSIDVRSIAFLKFTFTIVATAQWTGCLFFILAAEAYFDETDNKTNWVTNWVSDTFVSYDWRTASVLYTYCVVMFRGFSQLTNLGYEAAVPVRFEEMLLSIVTQTVKVVIDAYILGTLFHYIVKKDAKIEAAKERMRQLQEYCDDRKLSSELKHKIMDHMEYQQRQNGAVHTQVTQTLSQSLRARLAEHTCSQLPMRNRHLFGGCKVQFLQRFMMALREVLVLPGERLLTLGSMSREILFVQTGSVSLEDANGVVVELITAEGTAGNVFGAISFFLKVPEPYNINAHLGTETSTLVMSKSDYEDIVNAHPEQHVIILTNVLKQFGVRQDGSDCEDPGAMRMVKDDEAMQEMRKAIKRALRSSQDKAIKQLQTSIEEGDDETVLLLLARGVPVNEVDYDDRTMLHIAVAHGRLAIVKALLSKEADVTKKDAWGMTPLHKALELNYLVIARDLINVGARLRGCDFEFVQSALDQPAKLELICGRAEVSPNIADYDGRTLLHYAAAHSFDMVQNLIAVGARMNVPDRWGSFALEAAVDAGNSLVVRMLRQNGACVSTPYAEHATFTVATSGSVKALLLAEEAGVQLHAVNYEKMQALHLAARDGRLICVAKLATMGFQDIELKDSGGRTALDHALDCQQWPVVVLLMGLGARCERDESVEALRAAEAAGKLPSLHSVKVAARIALASGNPTVSELTSPVSEPKLAALGEQSFGRNLMFEMLKGATLLRQEADEVVRLLGESYSILTVTNELLRLVVTKPRSSRAFARASSRSRISVQASGEDGQTGTASGDSLVKAVMSAFMRSSAVEEALNRLRALLDGSASMLTAVVHERMPTLRNPLQASGDGSPPFGGGSTATLNSDAARGAGDNDGSTGLERLVEEIFGFLCLSPNWQEHDFDEMEELVATQNGLSAVTLFQWPYFRRAVKQAAERTQVVVIPKWGRKASRWSQLNTSFTGRPNKLKSISSFILPPEPLEGNRSAETLKAVHTSQVLESVEPQNRTTSNDTSLLGDLLQAYSVIDDLFDTITSGKTDVLDMSVHEEMLSTILKQLEAGAFWAKIVEQVPNGISYITRSAFAASFVLWVGVPPQSLSCWAELFEDNVEVGRQAPVESHDTCHSVELRDCDADDLVPWDEVADAGAVKDNVDELKALTQFFATWKSPLRSAAQLTLLERTAWGLFGWRPQNIADRVFDFLDGDGNGCLDPRVLMLLLQHLQAEINFTKATFDFVKETMAKSETCGIRREDIRAFFKTVASTRKAALPLDAQWFILHPESTFVTVWIRLMRVVSVYFCLEVPLAIAFRTGERYGLTYEVAHGCMEGLFVLDMVINFCRAYYDDRGVLIYDWKAVKKRYYNSEFLMDLVAALPLELLVVLNKVAVGTTSHTLASWVRLPKMLRAHRIVRAWRAFSRSTRVPSIVTAIFSLVVLMIGVTHMYACVWWYLGTVTEPHSHRGMYEERGVEIDHSVLEAVPKIWVYFYSGLGHEHIWTDDTPVAVQYLLSYYWIASTLSTNALVGLTTPKNAKELTFTIVCMITTLTVYAYVVGEISNLVMAADAQLVHKRQGVEAMRTFISEKALPLDLATDIVAFGLAGMKGAQRDDDVFLSLSRSLQVEVAMQLSFPLVKEARIFAHCSSSFSAGVSVLMREVTFAPEETVFRANDACHQMLLVSSGACFVHEEATERINEITDRRERGDIIAEVPFLFEIRHTHTCFTGPGTTTVFALDHDDYEKLCSSYADDASKVIETVVTRLHDLQPAMSESRPSNAGSLNSFGSFNGSMLASSAGESAASVSSAHRRGSEMRKLHVAIQRQQESILTQFLDAVAANRVQSVSDMLLKGVVNTNSCNADMRTALHVAASKGHLDMVKLLVHHYNSLVDQRDKFGHSPLDAALHGRHLEISKYLLPLCAPQSLTRYRAAFLRAAAEDDLAYVELLLAVGLDPNIADDNQRTALHVAVCNQSIQVLNYLLTLPGIELGPVDAFGNTPLWNALEAEHVEIARLLRRQSAPIQEGIALKINSRMAAGHLRFVAICAELGVLRNCWDSMGRSPLHIAATQNLIEAAITIIRHVPALVNSMDVHCCTALDNAIDNGHSTMRELLTSHGALRGSDPSLQEAKEATIEWVQASWRARAKSEIGTILTTLPEIRLAASMRAVRESFAVLVHVSYTNVLALLEQLQGTLPDAEDASTAADVQRVLETITASYTHLRDVLRKPVADYSLLTHRLVGLLSEGRMRARVKRILKRLPEVFVLIQKLEGLTHWGTLNLPPPTQKALQRLAHKGLFASFNQGIPLKAQRRFTKQQSSSRVWEGSTRASLQTSPERGGKVRRFLPRTSQGTASPWQANQARSLSRATSELGSVHSNGAGATEAANDLRSENTNAVRSSRENTA